MKNNWVKLLIILLVSIMAFTGCVRAKKEYSNNKSLDMEIESLIDFIKPEEKEMWGFEENDDLNSITVGEGVLVYYLNAEHEIVTDGKYFYYLYCDGKMRTGLIMKDDVLIQSTGGSGYLADYIRIYEKELEKDSSVSNYSVLQFRNTFLLMYRRDDNLFLIGDPGIFQMPKENAYTFQSFLEELEGFIKALEEFCAEYGCD